MMPPQDRAVLYDLLMQLAGQAAPLAREASDGSPNRCAASA
jgi:hypothetical protein